MSFRIFIITILTTLLPGSILAAGAAEERSTPSDLAVWIFLAFCAVIIVAQLGTLVRKNPGKHITTGVENEKAAEHSESH